MEEEKCCCCTLKQGTITVAVLYSISYVIGCFIFAFADLSNLQLATNQSEYIPILRIVGVAVSALACFFSILVAVGASNDKPSLLLPWIILIAIGLICSALQVVLTLIAGSFALAAATAVGFAINTYCASVVWRCYKYLKRIHYLPTTTFTPAPAPVAAYTAVPYTVTPTATAPYKY